MRVNPIQTYSVNNKNFNSKFACTYLNHQCKYDSFSYSKEKNSYKNAIAFKGITAKGLVKQRGMMFHITSLPAERSYCGQFGDPQTNAFIKWLKESKQTHWIMNPLNALEDNLCPYSGAGRFSRNKFIINLNKLTGKEYGKLLKFKELPDDISVPDFTLEMLEKQKNPRFKLAFERFKNLSENEPIKQEYNKFVRTNDDLWLEYYASYDAISKLYGKDWTLWNEELQKAPEIAKKMNLPLESVVVKSLNKLNKNISEETILYNINRYKFEQFLFDKQFNEFIETLDKNGIHLILDLPIGVSATGIDTWGKKSIFLLGENYKPTKVSGCPPEGNYNYTQVWGHALYDYDSPAFWKYQEDSIKQLVKSADLRLDHFVGYINRAEIPTSYTKSDGTILKDGAIFKPICEGGMGEDFFLPEWISNIDDKRSPKGENMFELFMRIAKEAGKNPEDTYILENFGPLAETKAYRNFHQKYGQNFVSQRVPVAMGLKEVHKKENINSPFKIDKTNNIALLTGNHDLPSLKQILDDIINSDNPILKGNLRKKQRTLFQKFCKEELNLTDEEMKDKNIIFENIMKWHYVKNVRQTQTTLQDALGIYFRPNIPGYWNGMEDKYLMKPAAEALLPYWSRVFPRDFLTRDNKFGINPGYKQAAEKFTAMMKELFD